MAFYYRDLLQVSLYVLAASHAFSDKFENKLNFIWSLQTTGWLMSEELPRHHRTLFSSARSRTSLPNAIICSRCSDPSTCSFSARIFLLIFSELVTVVSDGATLLSTWRPDTLPYFTSVPTSTQELRFNEQEHGNASVVLATAKRQRALYGITG